MSRSTHSEQTARFHRIVAEGSLDDLRAALQAGVVVDAPGHCGRTALMAALEARDLDKVRLLLQHGADPEQTDDFNHTTLRRAVEYDFAAGVRYLLKLGVDRGYHPRHPLKPIDYDFHLPEVPLPESLAGTMSAAEWKKSFEEMRSSMRERGQSPKVEPVITCVQSVEVLKLLLAAGDDLQLAPRESKRELIGLRNDVELSVGPSDYRRHKSPRFGVGNPEPIDAPFWTDMIRTGVNAYAARAKFDDLDEPGPIWCYDRFGSSLTLLDDGRFVQIGGEHEDHYDRDFCIYNDVVVHDGRGGFRVYGYAAKVFPPTDFHTATLCGDGIYIVGCLGYMDERRQGFTPVYRLTPETWCIELVATTGEMPGWIHRHRAEFDPELNTLRIGGGLIQIADEAGQPDLVANEGRFELDLNRMQWRQMT